MENENTNVGLQSPWITVHNYLKAMFGDDPDVVEITDVIKEEEMSTDALAVYSCTIIISNIKKLWALDHVLKSSYEFGNIEFRVFLELTETIETDKEILSTIFENNPHFDSIVTLLNPMGQEFLFTVFKKEVIQFYNDDITDAYGNWNGLMEDIAREVFSDHAFQNNNFCTESDAKDFISFTKLPQKD